MSDKKSVYDVLSKIDVGAHTQQDQGGNRYISWANAWNVLLKEYPDSTFEFHTNDVGDAFFVSSFGVEVRVTVTIGGLARTFTHPVLNSINKAMKLDPYSYTTKKGDRHVEACTTFDINSARMRALVKCVGMHGLALYLYSKDLQPEMDTVDSKQLQAMTDAIKARNLSIAEVCKSWNVEKLAQVHAVNFDNFIEWIGK